MNYNGIDLDVLGETVEGIRQYPEAGTVTVHTRHRWDEGFAVDGRSETVEQAGQALTRTHTFRTDWPEPWGGDSGPTPGAESLMATLGACVATTYIAKAALKGVAIDALEITVEGQVDLQGLFELGSACSRFFDVGHRGRAFGSRRCRPRQSRPDYQPHLTGVRLAGQPRTAAVACAALAITA